MKEEGEGGALCEEKGDAANAARLQVLAAGGAPEPIRPTSVHKSGRTHTLALSLSPLSLSLYLFSPLVFFSISISLNVCPSWTSGNFSLCFVETKQVNF